MTGRLPTRFGHFAMVALLVLSAALAHGAAVGEGCLAELRDNDVPIPFFRSAAEDRRTIVLDLKVHLLHAADSKALTASLSMGDLARIFAGVNRVWSQAGIRWRPIEVTRVEARNSAAHEGMLAGETPRRPGMVAGIVPPDAASDGWDVFFVRDLGGMAGGVYLPPITAVVQGERGPSGVRDIEVDLVRILSHELGHALSLPHVQCPEEGNLMSPGCTEGNRTRLATEQIEQARCQAQSGRPYSGRASGLLKR